VNKEDAMSKPPLRVIEKEPRDKSQSLPEFISKISVIDFAAIKELRGLTKDERLRKSHGWVDDLRPYVVIAAEINSREKEELVGIVGKLYDDMGSWLMDLNNANYGGLYDGLGKSSYHGSPVPHGRLPVRRRNRLDRLTAGGDASDRRLFDDALFQFGVIHQL
jgi:hypothetical protein